MSEDKRPGRPIHYCDECGEPLTDNELKRSPFYCEICRLAAMGADSEPDAGLPFAGK